MAILIFFLAHWFLSLFFQSFFHHRYSSHGMFHMSKGWERIIHFGAFLTQGSSYLVPRAYAIMHQQHHDHSDTELDPHSPVRFGNAFQMMMDTYRTYKSIALDTSFTQYGSYARPPQWTTLERLGSSKITRLLFVAGYTAFYWHFATAPWQFLLLPIHFLMGPVHGAIVNWCGHRYGYRNFPELQDDSRNTLPVDFVTLGELFQNNHHKHPSSANFAYRKFEVDPIYPVIRLFALLRIIRWPVREPEPSSGNSQTRDLSAASG